MDWRRYFLWRVPLALLAILLIGQGLAMVLAHVPLRRSYMDDLAIAVERDHTPYRVVLLGDSVTMMATRRFALGRGPHDVAKLATIAFSGAAAELFLLERYLASHPAPQYVLYAAAPDDLQGTPNAQITHYYDWNVYDHPEERAFLRRNVPGIAAREDLPAVLDVQENIIERLFSLGRRAPPPMPAGEQVPTDEVAAEPADANRMSARVETLRAGEKLEVGPLQRAVFSRICELSRQYGFRFDIVWPPLPQPVEQAWIQRGEFRTLDAQLATTLGGPCNAGPIFDVNRLRTYPAFDRQGLHVEGEGWEERYAADLSRYVAALPDRPTLARGR